MRLSDPQKLSVIFIVLLSAVILGMLGMAMDGLSASDAKKEAKPTKSGVIPETAVAGMITALDGESEDLFGWDAALNADGSVAVVGALCDFERQSFHHGSAYIYLREGAVWKQAQKLVPPQGPDMLSFGKSVTVSADGKVIVVGAYGDDYENGNDQGSAYVYKKKGGEWVQIQKLTYSDGGVKKESGFADGRFGCAVSVSADGKVIMVGEYYDSFQTGKAYIYRWNGEKYKQETMISAPGAQAGDEFGYHAALSGDGKTALIGAGFADTGVSQDTGAAYLFTNSGASWALAQKIVKSDFPEGAYLGRGLGLSFDGSVVVLGASGYSGLNGAALVYEKSGTAWNLARMFFYPGEAEGMGLSIAVSSNGTLFAAGAYRSDNGGLADQGKVYLFRKTPGGWELANKFVAQEGSSGDYFGGSVAISADGKSLMIGEYGDDIGEAKNIGSVWWYPLK
ncbi:MAG: hypothetical protein A2Y33_06280 [Spirochaetes bacterium GWF1_51_8]|nr:MAG: hypothetical protein A2Y33_06280 [Spirochaetes bacterium GWF1_51_8]